MQYLREVPVLEHNKKYLCWFSMGGYIEGIYNAENNEFVDGEDVYPRECFTRIYYLD